MSKPLPSKVRARSTSASSWGTNSSAREGDEIRTEIDLDSIKRDVDLAKESPSLVGDVFGSANPSYPGFSWDGYPRAKGGEEECAEFFNRILLKDSSRSPQMPSMMGRAYVDPHETPSLARGTAGTRLKPDMCLVHAGVLDPTVQGSRLHGIGDGRRPTKAPKETTIAGGGLKAGDNV